MNFKLIIRSCMCVSFAVAVGGGCGTTLRSSDFGVVGAFKINSDDRQPATYLNLDERKRAVAVGRLYQPSRSARKQVL